MTDKLEKQIGKAAEVLKSFGAKEVYVFGSVTTDSLRKHSDIDMAVVGLPAKVFLKAIGEATDVMKRPVDLVDLNKTTPFSQYLRQSRNLKRVG